MDMLKFKPYLSQIPVFNIENSVQNSHLLFLSFVPSDAPAIFLSLSPGLIMSPGIQAVTST